MPRSDLATKPPTAKEKERETFLLRDPLANLLSPELVECKQCLKKIKLSKKSNYDTFHWRNHKVRCMKMMKKKKRKNFKEESPQQSLPISEKVTATPGSPAEPRTSKTPSLTDNSDSEEIRELAQSPEILSPVSPPPSPPSLSLPRHTILKFNHTDPLFEAYIHRLHPDCLEPPVFDDWHSWSWSRLKEPRFNTRAYREEDDDGDDLKEGRFDKRPYGPHPGRVIAEREDHEAAHAPSTLSCSY